MYTEKTERFRSFKINTLSEDETRLSQERKLNRKSNDNFFRLHYCNDFIPSFREVCFILSDRNLSEIFVYDIN